MNLLKLKKVLSLIIITILLSSCTAYKSVNIGNVSDVNFKGMVDNKISLEMKVPVNNTNAYRLKIKSMDLDVTVNGNYLGKLKNSKEIVIAAKSDSVYVFPVDVTVKNVLSSMSTMYKLRRSRSFEMQIEGTIRVKALLHGRTIKVSEKQNVSL